MTLQNQNQQDETQSKDVAREAPQAPSAKKPFVEPEISQPVNVLEATTFFQSVDSGATN